MNDGLGSAEQAQQQALAQETQAAPNRGALWGWASTVGIMAGLVLTLILSYINGIDLVDQSAGSLLGMSDAVLMGLAIAATVSYIVFVVSIYAPTMMERRQARYRFTAHEGKGIGLKGDAERVGFMVEKSALPQGEKGRFLAFLKAASNDGLTKPASLQRGALGDVTTKYNPSVLVGMLRDPSHGVLSGDGKEGTYKQIRDWAQKLSMTSEDEYFKHGTDIVEYDMQLRGLRAYSWKEHGIRGFFTQLWGDVKRLAGYTQYMPILLSREAYLDYCQANPIPSGSGGETASEQDDGAAKQPFNLFVPTFEQHRWYNRSKAVGFLNALPNIVLVYAGGNAALLLTLSAMGVQPDLAVMLPLQVALAFFSFTVSYIVTRKSMSTAITNLVMRMKHPKDFDEYSKGKKFVYYLLGPSVGLISLIRMLWSFMMLGTLMHAGTELSDAILVAGIFFAATTGLAGYSLTIGSMERGWNAISQAWDELRSGDGLQRLKISSAGLLVVGLATAGSLLAFAISYDLMTQMISGVPEDAALALSGLITLMYLCVQMITVSGMILNKVVSDKQEQLAGGDKDNGAEPGRELAHEHDDGRSEEQQLQQQQLQSGGPGNNGEIVGEGEVVVGSVDPHGGGLTGPGTVATVVSSDTSGGVQPQPVQEGPQQQLQQQAGQQQQPSSGDGVVPTRSVDLRGGGETETVRHGSFSATESQALVEEPARERRHSTGDLGAHFDQSA